MRSISGVDSREKYAVLSRKLWVDSVISVDWASLMISRNGNLSLLSSVEKAD